MPQIATIRIFFPNIRVHFSNFQEKVGETSLPLPSSYVPDLACHQLVPHLLPLRPFIKTLCRNIQKSTFKMMNILSLTFHIFVHFFKYISQFLQACFKGCLYEKKGLGNSRGSRLAGMILIFIYMRSFVLVYRDKYITWYCFELVSLILVTVPPSLLLIQLSFLAYQLHNLILYKPFVISLLRFNLPQNCYI